MGDSTEIAIAFERGRAQGKREERNRILGLLDRNAADTLDEITKEEIVVDDRRFSNSAESADSENAVRDQLEHEWLTLDEACAMKGISPKTARNKRWLQPNNGDPDGIIGGRRKWRRQTVLDWLTLTDRQLRS